MIDVIIPVYNAYDCLEKLLRSIEKQTINDKFYVTVVDDGNDTSIKTLVDKLQLSLNIKVIRLPFNRGAAIARMIGLKKTCNEYVIFLDADDELIGDNSLEQMYNIINANSKYNLVAAKEVRLGRCSFRPYHILAKILRRSIIRKYNLCFPNYKLEEDTAFMMSYLSVISNDSICYVNKAIYKYNKNNPNSITAHNVFLQNYDYKEFYKAINYAYKVAKRNNDFHFLKENLLEIYISIIIRYYNALKNSSYTLKTNASFLKRTKRFYNNYKVFLNYFDIKSKLSNEEYELYVWFDNLIREM